MSASLPHNASLPTYPIAYSVQRTAYRYVPRRYVYLPSFSPHLITRPSLPSSPIPSPISFSPISSPSSSSFYSSTPSPTGRPEGLSRRGFCPVTREDKLRYDSWAWLVLVLEKGALERRSVEGGIEVPSSCTVFEYWQE